MKESMRASVHTISHRKRKQTLQDYVLEVQVGFLLRQANQRHTAIFVSRMSGELTTTQFAALAKLYEVGPCSQNRLGRLTAMDAATIKVVIDRLRARGFTKVARHSQDTRLLMVELTPGGLTAVESAIPNAIQITRETLAPLAAKDRIVFLKLLKMLC
ncbi:MAG: MarR family winged helix-turn-helix transcriptional regulator [Candidatus Acidiferrales bacterium]